MSGVVYVVDDEPSVLEVLARLFESIRLEVHTFADAHEFLSHADLSCHPRCLLVDLRMPEMSGLALQEELVRRNEKIPTIFMTAYGDVSSCVRAMRNGALEFLEKPLNEQEVLDTTCHALHLDKESEQRRATTAVLRERYRHLTRRERQVFNFVNLGFLNKQIAFELGISEGTVKTYRAQMMEKMAADSLPQLVRMAQQLESRENFA